ncbi:MAG: EAL domain-containing response regulator [Hormoscilla sp. GUM202]|nr:EAL domain-containing response regulator [Hormoscilla sp. GUM202]
MKKILVIEDEEFIRENLVEMLLDEKFTVLEAENGAIGVELARQERPDLILCDVMMPELDGYGVLSKLRSDYPEIGTTPFIFLTAKGDRKDLRQGMSLGAGAEALLRWQHPERGLVSPAKFIPIAEETGLIVPIGQWVLQTACQQVQVWQIMGYSDLRIAVNLSARQFQQPDLRRNLVEICLSTGLDPKYLDLELTESTVVQNPEVAIATLQELKTLGVQLALDDFGTGYSSLSYLQRFPFDILKIDRVFIHQSTVNEKNQALTTGIIKMAHQLHLKVIAEGVEREAERNLLCQQHCDEMQGYLFSRPLTAKGFQQLLFS